MESDIFYANLTGRRGIEAFERSRMDLDFAEHIQACPTVDSVGVAFAAAILLEGYSSSACRAVSRSVSIQSRPMFRNWSVDWLAVTKEYSIDSKSPVLREAPHRQEPFAWRDLSERPNLSHDDRLTWRIAATWGWTDGFVVPIHGPGGYFATVSMASMEKGLNLRPTARARLQMMALIAHQRIRTIRAPNGPPDLREVLTVREIECLRWVACGKTDADIGFILGISVVTVRFHVDNILRKLGAANRAQAAVRIALSGLL